jgi:hypothetical protein
MASYGLPTPRAIGGCSLKQPTTFYPSPIRRTIYDTPLTVGGTHEAPSMLSANDDTRTRSVVGKSTAGITTSQHGVRPPGPSPPRLQLVAPPGDDRGTMTTTPLPGKDIITDDKKTSVEYRHLLHVSGPFNGPPNFKVSNVDKYEPKQNPGGWLTVYTTAARAAGATEDVMTAYLPIVLGQDALQWLRHLPRHCIDWSDFSRRFTANFQSLSDKPTQPWDLKSIKRRGDKTLQSYLKIFQTMRNRIPEVAEAAVIEDFYRGSNDSAFVRAILQKAPTTSEQLFREADLYITADERALDLIGGAKPAPTAPRRDTNQQPDKHWEKRPREEVHAARPPASRARGGPHGGERTLDDILDAQCPYHKDMRHTLWNCRDFKHSMGNDRPFQPLPPPPQRGGPGEPRQPQQEEEGGGGAFPRVDREVNVIFRGHGSQESKRQQKLNDRQILVAATGPPAPYRWSKHPITFTRADQWLNFDHPGKYPLLVDPVIRESRVKKVLVDGGSSINVTFPRTL